MLDCNEQFKVCFFHLIISSEKAGAVSAKYQAIHKLWFGWMDGREERWMNGRRGGKVVGEWMGG